MRNIIDKFLRLKTWQKLTIGIAILTIFKMFCLHNFIINVKAESIDSTIPSIILVDPDSSIPIFNPSLLERGKYSTNFVSSTVINNLQTTQNCYLGQFKYFGVYNNQLSGWGERQTRLIENGEDYYNIRSEYINGFEFEIGTNQYYIDNFQPNSHYSFMFSILSEDVTYSNQTFNTNDFNFRLFMLDYNHIRTDSTSLIKNLKVQYIPGGSINNNQQFSFISISFDTRNNFYYTELGSMEIDLYNYQQPTGSIDTAKWLYKSNGQDSWTGIYQVVMVQDADLMIIKSSDVDSYFGFSTGEPLNQQQYENCDTLDIACHVRNIQKGIENFANNIIYSFVTTLKYLFVPDFDLITTYINDTRDVINLKYPDVQGLIDYAEYFKTRLDNIQPKHTISFSGASVPGFGNIQLIPSFTFNFDDILRNEPFSTYYILARSVMTGILIISYCVFVFKFFSKIFHDLPTGDGGGN